jgi:hypothetical protein
MRMDPISVRARVGHMSRTRRYWLYAVAMGAWLTGALWLITHFFLTSIDSFGFENAHPTEKWWLIAHAVFSFYCVWWFGLLWPNHVTKSWRARIRRGTGGVVFGCMAWLTLTGCTLYYLGSEEWRSWFSILHWLVGLAALVAFIVHLRTRTARA